MTPVIGKVTLKARALYVCADCRTEAFGDTLRAEADSYLEALQQLKQAPNSNLPMGWASYGYLVRCPECKSKRSEVYKKASIDERHKMLLEDYHAGSQG
jgi:DNA-directed RNA polymerase subunit RPC12/RpoP